MTRAPPVGNCDATTQSLLVVARGMRRRQRFHLDHGVADALSGQRVGECLDYLATKVLASGRDSQRRPLRVAATTRRA
jgi:hypothetical protein